MTLLTNESITDLLSARQPPCLSLYQPTHRRHPENQQDPIRFRNLVKTIEGSLRQKYSAREVQPFLEPFQTLAGDRDFWNHTLDGLAVFGALGILRVYKLQRPVAELAIVADSFHVKPLMRIFQSADRYQILGLNQQEVKLFEGNRDVLDEVELAPNVPRTITDVLGEKLTEPHLTVTASGGVGGVAIYQGSGAKKDEVTIDVERFFRAVDRAILKHHSQPSGLTLLLAALPEHHHLFRQISHNPFLMADGIDIHPDVLRIDALRDRAWRVIEPQVQARLAKLADDFAVAKSQGRGMDDLAKVAEAALAGRVATLLIEADRQIAGRIDTMTGQIQFADLNHPEVDDLLDDLGELVLKKGGCVVVVPVERMPTLTGLAATYRY